QRPPFFWVINANTTFNIYSVAIPFTATFTSQNSAYTQPFNQFGISPKYKWITGHLGFRSMQFSEFSLGGLIFLGAGVEIKPEKSRFQGKAMYGRLAKAIPVGDGSVVASGQPAYERWGYAAQIGYRLDIGELNFTLFRAKDDASSIDPDTVQLPAQENIVTALSGTINITPKLSLSGEFGLSTYTNDISMPAAGENDYGYANNFRFLYTPNASSVRNGAGTATLTYNLGKSNLGVTYRRVGPQYKSMGAIYLNNDLENYTFNAGTNLFNSRVALNGSIGLQKNNLAGDLLNTDQRIIGALNTSVMVTKKIMVAANFSNFRSSNEPSATNIQDTVRFVQVTNGYGLLVGYSTGNENVSHGINTSGNYQKADAIQDNSVFTITDGSEFYNANVSYSLGFPKLKTTFNVAGNYNRFVSAAVKTEAYGPTLGATKSIWRDKVQGNFAISYIDNFQNASFLNNSVSYLFGLGYKIDRFNSIRLDGRYLSRKLAGNLRGSETQFGVTYNFNF
ncbi:MAG: hypothetical protein KDC37_06070, partial [Flavobacteriales bacterium]|nr:hypothetical protein [Flavobacteriales bacterium]